MTMNILIMYRTKEKKMFLILGRKGDSLSKIASRNGTTVARLCRLNGLKTTSKLQIGQKIKLR